MKDLPFSCATLRHLSALGEEICPETPWMRPRRSMLETSLYGRLGERVPVAFSLSGGRWSLPEGTGGRGRAPEQEPSVFTRKAFFCLKDIRRHPISIRNNVYYCLQVPAPLRAPDGSQSSFLLSEGQASILFFPKLFFSSFKRPEISNKFFWSLSQSIQLKYVQRYKQRESIK